MKAMTSYVCTMLFIVLFAGITIGMNIATDGQRSPIRINVARWLTLQGAEDQAEDVAFVTNRGAHKGQAQ